MLSTKLEDFAEFGKRLEAVSAYRVQRLLQQLSVYVLAIELSLTSSTGITPSFQIWVSSKFSMSHLRFSFFFDVPGIYIDINIDIYRYMSFFAHLAASLPSFSAQTLFDGALKSEDLLYPISLFSNAPRIFFVALFVRYIYIYIYNIYCIFIIYTRYTTIPITQGSV